MKVSVSFIKSKLKEQETVMKIAESKADYIHVDIMDGKFVPTKNYTFKDVYKFVSGISKPLDIHLMCEKPEKYVRNFAMLNTEFITFHLEAVNDVDKMIDIIHSYGIKCGISIKPETNVTLLEPYLDKIELVLIMTVEPGKGGQEFITDMASKVDKVRELNKKVIISADGGVNDETVKYLKDCDMVVSGSYVCMNDNYDESINKLKNYV